MDNFILLNNFCTTSGQFLTKALFLEESYSDLKHVQFTLQDEDHRGYRSLYKLYKLCSDPTEIEFAKRYLGGWEHWQLLCSLSWFKPYVSRWREELELEIRSRALANVLEVSKDPEHKFNYEANKYLLSGMWKTKEEKSKVGRPTKEAIREQANNLFLLEKETQEDYLRLKDTN